MIEYIPGLEELLPSTETLADFNLNRTMDVIMSSNNTPIKDLDSVTLYVAPTSSNELTLYLCGNTMLEHPYFQNNFITFLDSLSSEQTLTIIMGSTLYGSSVNIALGGMIAAMLRCKARIRTKMVGYGGFTETVLWLFGKDLEMSNYGALTFTGMSEVVKQFKMYPSYFTYIYKTALEKGIITEERYNELLTTSKSFMLLKSELSLL